jgi:hypothetical protein
MLGWNVRAVYYGLAGRCQLRCQNKAKQAFCKNAAESFGFKSNFLLMCGTSCYMALHWTCRQPRTNHAHPSPVTQHNIKAATRRKCHVRLTTSRRFVSSGTLAVLLLLLELHLSSDTCACCWHNSCSLLSPFHHPGCFCATISCF